MSSLEDLAKFIPALSVLEGVFQRVAQLEEDKKKDLSKHTINRLEQKLSAMEFSLNNLKLNREVDTCESEVVTAILRTPKASMDDGAPPSPSPLSPLKGDSKPPLGVEAADGSTGSSAGTAGQGGGLTAKAAEAEAGGSEGRGGATDAAKGESAGGEAGAKQRPPKVLVSSNATHAKFGAAEAAKKEAAGEKLKLDSLCKQVAKSEARMSRIEENIAKQMEKIWEKIDKVDKATAPKTPKRGHSSRNLHVQSPRTPKHGSKAEKEETRKRTLTDTALDKTIEKSQPRPRTKTRTKSMDKDEQEGAAVAAKPESKPPAPEEQSAIVAASAEGKSSASSDVKEGDGEHATSESLVDKPSEEEVVNGSDELAGAEEPDDLVDINAFNDLKAEVDKTNETIMMMLHKMKADNDGMRVMVTNLQTTVTLCENATRKTTNSMTELRDFQDKYKSRAEKDGFATQLAEDKMQRQSRRFSMKNEADVKDGIDKIVEKQKLQEEATRDEARARNAILEKAYASTVSLHDAIDHFVNSSSLEHDSFFTGKLSETMALCKQCMTVVGDDKTKVDALVLFNKLFMQCTRNSKITSSAVGKQMKVLTGAIATYVSFLLDTHTSPPPHIHFFLVTESMPRF
jgi:hypothetical protein